MKKIASIALAAAAVAASAPAQAANCSDLPNPVYAAGSSAFKAILGELAKTLAGGASPTTIVYVSKGSCDGVDAVLNGTPLVAIDPKPASYWDPTGTELNCEILADPPQLTDIGISDVFPTTCFNLPNGLTGIVDFAGPVQPMTFVVPKLSKQTSISAEAAYFAFGFGKGSGVAPWEDEASLFIRDESSGTQQMISAAIGVPAARWKGVSVSSTDDMRAAVANGSNPEATLGIIVADAADANRDNIKELAYQHFDQTCGYWPDSDPLAFDKKNVRDGHYAIWGPLHILAKVDGSGFPSKTAVKNLVSYITGTQNPPSGLDIIQLEAQNHVVPQCAMHVKRTEELGPLASFQPEKSCGCYYEKLAGGTTDCSACTTASTCPKGFTACNFGFCEN